ncbi:MAG: RDD family protein [Terracidiphilus sp.]
MMAMEPIGDQLNIDTPELVAIEMPLAGIGSRFIAILVDYLIWGFVFLILGIVAAIIIPALHFFGGISANWAIGIFVLIVFLLQWGYFALFEAFGNGRTPGKRVARIRVIHQSGRGINFVESLARNLVRFVDYFPGFYAVGIVAIFLSRRNQRLGDMVAGTLVVRDREVDSPHWGESASRTFTAPTLIAGSPIPPPGFPQAGAGPWGGPPHLRVLLPAPALAKLSASDLEVLEGFFARRLDMDVTTRAALAGRIASALCAKSGLTIPQDTSVETFLEAVAHQFRGLGRMS